MRLRKGQIVGERLRVEELLGEGGLAEVYLVTHTHLGGQYALKCLKPNFAHKPKIRQRFLDEAMTMKGIIHPNVVRIHKLVDDGDVLCFYMDYLPHGSLYDRLQREGALPGREVCRLFMQVLEGLAAGHEQKVVHRDVKPHNILIDGDGNPKIADFGIASQEGATHGFTQAGVPLGTYWFMPPEQFNRAEDEDPEPRADIYAAGVSVHMAASGFLAFPDRICFFDAILESPDLLQMVIEPLRPVITKATAIDPNDRYQNAKEMSDALKDAARRLPTITEEVESRRPVGMTMVPDDGSTGRSVFPLSEMSGSGQVSVETGTRRASFVTPATAPSKQKQPLVEGTIVEPGKPEPSMRRTPRGVWIAGAGILPALTVFLTVYGLGRGQSAPDNSGGTPDVVGDPPSAASPTEAVTSSGAVPVPASVPPPVPASSPKPVQTKQTAARPESGVKTMKMAPSTPPPSPVEPALTRVTFVNATSVRIVGEAGTFTLPTSVPPGSYTIYATFGQDEVKIARRLTVLQEPAVVTCDADAMLCKSSR